MRQEGKRNKSRLEKDEQLNGSYLEYFDRSSTHSSPENDYRKAIYFQRYKVEFTQRVWFASTKTKIIYELRYSKKRIGLT